jgi:hypothetical protein
MAASFLPRTGGGTQLLAVLVRRGESVEENYHGAEQPGPDARGHLPFEEARPDANETGAARFDREDLVEAADTPRRL